jgi:hypothetical protein
MKGGPEAMAANEEAPSEDMYFAPRFYVDTAKSAIESLIHIVEEAISNEDEAISRRARREGEADEGTIVVGYDPEEMVLTVAGDGDGLTTEAMRRRLKQVGDSPQADAKRGYFHRGIREVFLAMGGGEITSIGMTDEGRQVLSKAVFEGTPKIRIVTQDEEPSPEQRAELGLEGTGTVVRIPVRRFAQRKSKKYEFGPLEQQIRDCVGLRPVLADPSRHIYLEYGNAPRRRLVFEYPEGEDLVAEKEVAVGDEKGAFWAKLTEKPVKRNPAKRARIAGILIRGERAAYEVSLGRDLSTHPAMARVVGELRLDGIEKLQREADDDSQIVYKADRSGLNPEHPLVEAAYELIDETLGPLIADLDAAEDRTHTTPDMRRELQKLVRVINEAIEGLNATEPEEGGDSRDELDDSGGDGPSPPAPPDRELLDPIEFRPHERAYVMAGQSRTVEVWFDTAAVAEGSPVAITTAADEIVTRATLSGDSVPVAAADGVAALTLTLEGGDSEGRHEVTVRSGEHTATLPVHVRFPRTSGFISQIVPDERDWTLGSALFEPKTGTVRVYIGRPEFKAVERRVSRDGLRGAWTHPEYRQLVVESVREAALWEAAKRKAEVEWDQMSPDERSDGDAFHGQVRYQFQELDYLLRVKLHKAFARAGAAP